MRLSMRGLGRTLRVARTLAHLSASHRIATSHVAEALRYRGEADEPARTAPPTGTSLPTDPGP